MYGSAVIGLADTIFVIRKYFDSSFFSFQAMNFLAKHIGDLLHVVTCLTEAPAILSTKDRQ